MGRVRPGSRLFSVTLVVVWALLLTGCAGDRVREPSPAGGAGAEATGRPASFPASDVLRRWDRARARAFAEGDLATLRSLYVERSTAGTSDVRMLRAYLHRGLTVEGMRMQVIALEVLRQERRRLRLVVTDRLAGAVAVGPGLRVPLPRDRASRRLVELRRYSVRDPWRVALVRESSRRQAAPRGSAARTRTPHRAGAPARP